MECKGTDCDLCLVNRTEIAYMMSVGKKFYPHTGDFMKEAIAQGISKRIAALPRDFKVGESVVALAHHEAVLVNHEELVVEYSVDKNPESMFFNEEVTAAHKEEKPTWAPGIFTLFKPDRIEYVVKGDETDEFIERLLKRGITPVNVIHAEDVQLPMPMEGDRTEPDSAIDPTVPEVSAGTAEHALTENYGFVGHVITEEEASNEED
jgi:hypothetical protein